MNWNKDRNAEQRGMRMGMSQHHSEYPVFFMQRMAAAVLLPALLLVGAIFLGISTGSSGHSFRDVLHLIFGGGDDGSLQADIIMRIRLPRVILAAEAGAALSLGGLVFQALLRNPLAEPFILGISGGSAVGAVIGIILGFARFPVVTILAFAGGTASLAVVFGISARRERTGRETMILAGVMVNAFCSSVIMFLVSVVRDSRLHDILFWLMGDLSGADAGQTLILAFILLPCFILLFLSAKTLNLLAMGEEQAANMGVDLRATYIVLPIIVSLMVGSVVCHSGLLGFVGLVIPHLLRLMLGPDHRLLIPASALGGGAYLTLCDLAARAVPSHGELPVGVVTAMTGAPLFIFLLMRERR